MDLSKRRSSLENSPLGSRIRKFESPKDSNGSKTNSPVSSKEASLSDLEEKVRKLEKEAKDLRSEVQAKDKQLSELSSLKNRLKMLEKSKEEFEKTNKDLIDQLSKSVSGRSEHRSDSLVVALKAKLKNSEKLVAELTAENQEINREVKLLAQELEELHDTFREDQVSEFRHMKRELETNAKNIRVLQFKLKKAERMSEQLEEEKNSLEKRLSDAEGTSKVSYDAKKMREMENELAIAKEVSLKLHAEVGQLTEEKKRLEKELAEWKRKVGSSGDKCDGRGGNGDSGGGGASGMMSVKEQEELVRSLYDTMEREKDLQEQLRFAEEENRNVRKKLSTMEQENEILMMQIKKMANKSVKSGKESEEMNADEMKLHMELNEHEMSVVRKKSEEMQQENESLHNEVKYLQEKLVSQPMTKIELPQIPEGSPSNVIYEHKIRILESETRELRLKLVDRERENESLRTELEVVRRKVAKASMVRSRSLENETSVDLKRQLQLVEQEANILRQKIASLENENEKLSSENRRLQIRVSRRPTPGPVDELQIENMDLKEKIALLERRTSITSEMSSLMVSSSERDIISSMKKQIKSLEEEKVQLSRKVTELDLELSKISMDNRRLKECLDYKKTPMRVVRESATRLELKEIIHQMDGEINKLQATLEAKDMVIESLKEELSEAKKAVEMNQIELRSKQSSDQMRAELAEFKEKCSHLEDRLRLISRESGNESALKAYELEKEKKMLLNKIATLEQTAISERNNANDLVDKLNSMVRERDQLSHRLKSITDERTRLTFEITQLKDQVRTLQGNLADMKAELTEKNSVIESVKSEKDLVKKQLENERRNSSFSVPSKPKSLPGTTNSQEGLIKSISDLENRNRGLEKQLNDELKDHKQREMNLRKDHERQVQGLQEEVKAGQKQLTLLVEENKSLKSKLSASSQQIDKLTSDVKELTEKCKSLSAQNRKEKDDYLNMISDQEAQLRGEQRRREKMERDHEMVIKTKEEALLQTRERIFRLEREMKRMEILLEQEKRDHEIVVTNYEREVNKLSQEYNDLTSRQKALDQEFMSLKNKTSKEKDDLVETCNSLRRSLEEKTVELQKFKESSYARQEEWIKERLDYQEKLSEAQARSQKLIDSDLNSNKSSLQQEKDRTLDDLSRNERELKREVSRLRERCDELSGLKELPGKSSILQSSSDKMSKEVQSMKNRMDHAETSHRGELAALKAEFETRMKLMKDEVTVVLAERDHLRARVHLNSVNASHKDEIEDMRAAMETLRNHLEQALLENRNCKIEHSSERSSWQIQIAELKSKLNQADEQVLLETSRGSARSYTKTRLELAWEKERQELHKLLSDTQKLVEEMKSRIVSLEAAREKERSQARKQLQEMKVMMDREQEDTQRRIGELQLDLIDLRDSHARIRSQNDRLKRERLALEREREEFRLKMFAIIGIESKVIDISEQLNNVIKLVPEGEESSEKQTAATESLRTRRTRSRPLSETEINLKDLRKMLEELKTKFDEIVKLISMKDTDDSFRRSISFRKAISSTDMIPSSGLSATLMRSHRDVGGIRPPPRPKAMAKKSLSLDHNMAMGSSYEQIWDSGDESIQTTPGSSVSNLKYQPIYGHIRGGHSSISGYESDSSWRWTRESSYGSDVSAPAAMSGSGDHYRHHHSSSLSRPKKSIFRLLKRTHSNDTNALENVDSEGKSKDRDKKEKSLRSRISRTLRKTLSPSSSNLRKDSKDEKSGDSPGLKSINDRGSSSSAVQRTLSPTRVKPPLGYEASTSRGTTSTRPDVNLGNLRSNLRSVSGSSRSTRV